MFLRGHPGTPINPAPVLSSGISCSTSHSEGRMLGPALNHQPGFRWGTRRAKQRRKEQPCCGKLTAAATWLLTCLISWLAARLAAAGDLAADSAGWLPNLCLFVCLAGRAGSLAGWRWLALAGACGGSLATASRRWLTLADALAHVNRRRLTRASTRGTGWHWLALAAAA